MKKADSAIPVLLTGFILTYDQLYAQDAAADTNINSTLNDAWYSQGWFWIVLVILVVILMGIFIRNSKNRWTENNRNRP